MSAFLGPIHHWLYKKILIQDGLTNSILSEYGKSDPKGNSENNIIKELAEKYGELIGEPLEDIIDGTNIHGWLQQRISMVESRFADAVTILCTRDQATLCDLEKLAFAFGKAKRPAPLHSAKEWYSYFNDILLDGMPCDHVNEVISSRDDEVIWRQNQCIHKSYWNAVGGDINNYYRLRDAMIAGIIEGSGFIYEKTKDDTFKIKGGA